MSGHWEEINRFSNAIATVIVSCATFRGRTKYTIRIVTEKEDARKPDSTFLSPYVSVEFKSDNGAIREGTMLHKLAELLLAAEEFVLRHAREADEKRANEVASRDESRAQRSEQHAHSHVGRGLSRFSNPDRERTNNSAKNREQKREENRARGTAMKGKKG